MKTLRVLLILVILLLALSLFRLPNYQPFSFSPEIASRLENHVYVLSEEIGERSYLDMEGLNTAADYIIKQFEAAGYEVQVLPYFIGGKEFKNIEVVKPGSSETIVVGAHYDSLAGTKGADDNGSGVAVLLELARLVSNYNFGRTVRFVVFSSEEPPFFKTNMMGSFVYAKNLKDAGVNVVGMVSLEMVGYYSDKPRSQRYPLFAGIGRPSAGNFVAVVSDFSSRHWKNEVINALKGFPIESAWLFRRTPGVDWSDHWSFWQHDFPAVMITDTGPYRNPNYHRTTDTFDTLDYARMAALTEGSAQALVIIAD